MARRRLDAAEYTVGWICALPIELAAAQVMLDEEHLPHDGVNSTQYTLGRIGSHNVVLACLPAGQMGIGAAAFSAGQATSIFKSIRFGLMVGVGGGAPSEETDIRLGDVVVSQPVREHSGVVQYDFGKTGQAGRMTRTGSLNAPPQVLLHAVTQLRAYCLQHRQDKGSLTTYLSAFKQHPNFSREEAGTDALFEASYPHGSGATCERCSEDNMVRRTAREADKEVTIHYGTIGSGNQVIKDAATRDQLSKELGGVLCFEMEAAGLMNDFPCLVVRGICDYADSHKNKAWQPYAAATAAACAKSILSLVPAAEVIKTAAVGEHSKYRVPFSLKGVPVVGKFAERPRDTRALERAFMQEGDVKERRLLVLHGLGGMGKTQLAANFARRHQNRFSSVLWLDGSGESTLKQSLAAFASRIPEGQISETSKVYSKNQGGDIDAVVQGVLSWLSLSENKDWLMIIDNVDRDDRRRDEDEEAYSVEEYFPEADHGSVLITTRLLHLGQLGEWWEARKVDKEQARAIFRSLYSKDIGQEADELIELLDGLPLALAQAAAYMTETGTSFSTYTRLYREQWPRLMEMHEDRDMPLRNYANGSVATTWTISFTAIRQRNEAAANLLLLWAHLDNKNLWHGLLAEASQRSNLVASRTADWLGKMADSEVDFINAIRILRNYSLVEEAEEQTGYATHPVVHQWAFHIQDDSQRTALSWLAVVLVGLAVPRDLERNFWETQTKLLPHAEQCETCVTTYDLAKQSEEWGVSEEEESATMLLSAVIFLGDLYRGRDKLTKAEKMYMLVIGKEKDLSKQSNIYGLAAAWELSSVYLKQERFSEAKELLLQKREVEKRLYGRDAVQTLSTLEPIATVYIAQRKYDKAKKLMIQASNGFKRTVGEDHPLTLDSLRLLGWVYYRKKKYEKAEQILLKVLEGKKKTPAVDSLSIYATCKELGYIFSTQKKFGQAEEMFTQALKGYEKILGPKDVLTHQPALTVMSDLGKLFERLGNFNEARMWFLKALSCYEKLFGEEHEDCQRLRNDLADLDMRERDGDLDSLSESSDSNWSLEVHTGGARLDSLDRNSNALNRDSDSLYKPMASILDWLLECQDGHGSLERNKNALNSNSDSVYKTSDSDSSSKDEDLDGLDEHSAVETTSTQERSYRDSTESTQQHLSLWNVGFRHAAMIHREPRQPSTSAALDDQDGDTLD